jgi:TPR repeat protein
MVWLGYNVIPQAGESYSKALRSSHHYLMHAVERYDHPLAHCRLGSFYESGTMKGVPRDLAESIKRYRTAADAGYAEAQWRLANLYSNQSRHAEAIEYWTLSCEQGYTAAIFTFAEQLIFFPYARNPEKAVELYQRNISFGDLDVTFVYANILEHGYCGFPRDLPEASRLKEITKQANYLPTPMVLDVMKSTKQKSKGLMMKKMILSKKRSS